MSLEKELSYVKAGDKRKNTNIETRESENNYETNEDRSVVLSDNKAKKKVYEEEKHLRDKIQQLEQEKLGLQQEIVKVK